MVLNSVWKFVTSLVSKKYIHRLRFMPVLYCTLILYHCKTMNRKNQPPASIPHNQCIKLKCQRHIHNSFKNDPGQ